MHYFLANLLINQTKSTGTTHKNKYNNDYRTTNSTMMLKIPITWKDMPPTIPFDWKSIKSLGKTRRGRKRKHAPSNPAAVMHKQKRTRMNDDHDDDIDERIRPPDFHHAIPEPKESDIPKSALYSEPEVEDNDSANEILLPQIHEPIAWKNMPPTIPFDWKSIKSLGKTRRGRKRKHAPSNPAAVMHQQKRTRVNDDYDDDIDERIRPPDSHHAIPEPKESDIPKSALYSEPEVDDNDSVNEILHPQIHDPITAGANNVEDSLCYSDSDSDSDNSVIFRESFADDLILGLLCLNDVEEEQNSPSFFPSSPHLPQLRRSQRLANEATTLMSLPPQLPLLRRSPRLALKPRTSYVGMC